MKEIIFILVVFWLPRNDAEFPMIKTDVHKAFKTREDCLKHLKGLELQELEIYRFIDEGGRPGFYQCQSQVFEVKDNI